MKVCERCGCSEFVSYSPKPEVGEFANHKEYIKKVGRVLGLIIELAEHKTMPELCSILDVSYRTIYRDIVILQRAGIKMSRSKKHNRIYFKIDDLGALTVPMNKIKKMEKEKFGTGLMVNTDDFHLMLKQNNEKLEKENATLKRRPSHFERV